MSRFLWFTVYIRLKQLTNRNIDNYRAMHRFVDYTSHMASLRSLANYSTLLM